MASAVRKYDTAFSAAPAKATKRPRQKIEAHLAFIRTLPCLITGKRPVEAAHIRYADMRYGKRDTGMAEKPSDQWVVPLAPEIHADQHKHNEQAWWTAKGIDPCVVAMALWRATGDEETCEQIIAQARNPYNRAVLPFIADARRKGMEEAADHLGRKAELARSVAARLHLKQKDDKYGDRKKQRFYEEKKHFNRLAVGYAKSEKVIRALPLSADEKEARS